MNKNPYAYSLGLANPNGPACEDCGPKFIEEMSEDVPGVCWDCAERREIEALEAKRAEGVAEFRYASRYWLAVRPVNMRPLHELADERDVADAILEAADRARFLLGDRFTGRSLIDGTEPTFSAERDSRVAP